MHYVKYSIIHKKKVDFCIYLGYNKYINTSCLGMIIDPINGIRKQDKEMAKNEIVEMNENENAIVATQEQLTAFLSDVIGTSPLMEGKKFSSDDLIAADVVILRDFDWVDYVQDEGTTDEKDVHFSIWAVEVGNEDGTGDVLTETGYYQAGTVFNKIARALEKNPTALDMFRKYGQRVKCSWGQTSSKNKIVLVTVV